MPATPTPEFIIAIADADVQQAESEGGGSNITVLSTGYASVTYGDLVIDGALVGVALSDYDANRGGVALNIDGCWFLPVKANCSPGDIIYFHNSSPDYLDNLQAGDGIPIGLCIATGPAYTATAVKVAVKLVPSVRYLISEFQQATSGDITSTITEHTVFVPSRAGRITRAGFVLANTGADGTDALTLEMDLQIGGTTIFSTLPKISKTAADGASTFVAGTGVTVGVINTAADDFTAFQLVELTGTLVRTTPEDEMDGAVFIVEYVYDW